MWVSSQWDIDDTLNERTNSKKKTDWLSTRPPPKPIQSLVRSVSTRTVTSFSKRQTDTARSLAHSRQSSSVSCPACPIVEAATVPASREGEGRRNKYLPVRERERSRCEWGIENDDEKQDAQPPIKGRHKKFNKIQGDSGSSPDDNIDRRSFVSRPDSSSSFFLDIAILHICCCYSSHKSVVLYENE